MVTIRAAELEELRRLRKDEKDLKSDDQGMATSVDNVTNLVYSDPGILNQALGPILNSNSNWILNSGASRHVMGMPSEFASYTPYPYSHKETIQLLLEHLDPLKVLAWCNIVSIICTIYYNIVNIIYTSWQCTPSITISSVLYVSSFPVNLVSISSLVDQMDWRVPLDCENCLI